jgi:hypothetical protein
LRREDGRVGVVWSDGRMGVLYEYEFAYSDVIDHQCAMPIPLLPESDLQTGLIVEEVGQMDALR